MELIIDIPDKMYQEIKKIDCLISGRRNGKNMLYVLLNSIKNGTPLTEWLNSFDTSSATKCFEAVNILKMKIAQGEMGGAGMTEKEVREQMDMLITHKDKALEQHTNKEDKKMELRNEEKGYLENDKESVLETTQNIIADKSFQYGGDSLIVLEIINAIKDGYRLANLAEVDRRISDAFDKGFEEGIRVSKGRAGVSFDEGFKEGLKAASKKNDKPIFS